MSGFQWGTNLRKAAEVVAPRLVKTVDTVAGVAGAVGGGGKAPSNAAEALERIVAEFKVSDEDYDALRAIFADRLLNEPGRKIAVDKCLRSRLAAWVKLK